MNAMADLAVVIVNHNTRHLLRACLTTVQRQVSTSDATVVVVDNASSDGSVEMVRSEFPRVSLIANRENVGFPRANNMAIEASDSETVLLLNPDAFPRDGALDELRSVLSSDNRIAVAGPRMHEGDGRLLASAHCFESLGRLAATALGIHELLPSSALRWAARLLGRTGRLHRVNYEAVGPVEVDWVSGACMMVRRSALAEVGLLDERYFMYMEDEDWCRRFRNAAYRVVYVPSAEVTHLVGMSLSSKLRRARAYRDSRLIYHKQYNPRLYPVFSLLSYLYAVRQCGLLEALGLLDGRPESQMGVPAPREAEP